MTKIFIIIILIIAILFGSAWLHENEKDITKGTEDFLAIAIIVMSIFMLIMILGGVVK